MAHKALLIANWAYNDQSNVLAPLKGPRNDLPAMQRALTDKTFGLFEPADVHPHENLRADTIGPVLLEFLMAAGKEDRILLYFSGHGERRRDGLLALCGIDTKHELLEATSFNTNELRGWISDHNRASSTIVILDCCYAGNMKGTVDRQTLVESLGAGTMVLASGASQPVKDADDEDTPSPFTAALTRVLLDPDLEGDEYGWLTASSVHDRLTRLEPPLSPRPHLLAQTQGLFPLARREPPSAPVREMLKGFQRAERMEVVELRFRDDAVTARWNSGVVDSLDLTGLDPYRLNALRRLSQLADAVLRVPECADEVWCQRAVQKTWDCVGVNLFESALPPALRERICAVVDGADSDFVKDKHVLKVRIAFGESMRSIEPYPWEYLQVRSPSQGDETASDPLQPLALRSGLLIERAVSVPAHDETERASATAPTVGVVNCLQGGFANAVARVSEDLAALSELNVIMDQRNGDARWSSFVDGLGQTPDLLLLFAPLQRTRHGVEVGFVPDVPDEPEWHPAAELIRELRAPRRPFEAIVFVTFAAKPGQDSFRATLELARSLAQAGIGPVVFACHAPGFEAHIRNRQRDAFPVLLIDALTRGEAIDQAFYYAKNRIVRMGNADVRRTFGVPGYYVPVPADAPPPRPPVTTRPQSTSRTIPGAGGPKR